MTITIDQEFFLLKIFLVFFFFLCFLVVGRHLFLPLFSSVGFVGFLLCVWWVGGGGGGGMLSVDHW